MGRSPRPRPVSRRSVERSYSAMIDRYSDPVEENKVNCYSCTVCSHVTKSIDADNGVSSFMIACEKCGKQATSSFYQDLIPGREPTIKWVRPELSVVIKARKKPDLLKHYLDGGMLLVVIDPDAEVQTGDVQEVDPHQLGYVDGMVGEYRNPFLGGSIKMMSYDRGYKKGQDKKNEVPKSNIITEL